MEGENQNYEITLRVIYNEGPKTVARRIVKELVGCAKEISLTYLFKHDGDLVDVVVTPGLHMEPPPLCTLAYNSLRDDDDD